MSPGESVRHPQFGNGRLLAVQSRGGNLAAHVDFGYMREWVLVAELKGQDGRDLPNDAKQPPRTTSSRIGVKPLAKGVAAARSAIIALRLGQIREGDVVSLSVGTDDVQNQLKEFVKSAAKRRSCSVLIRGAYGSGKTHLLTMLSAIAAKRGLALASVLLDGEGTSMSEPNSLLSSILRSLRYPDEVAPAGIKHRLGPFARKRIGEDVKRRAGIVGETIRGFPAEALSIPELTDVLEDYLSLQLSATDARRQVGRLGFGTYLPTVRAWRVAKRPARFCKLLTEWAEFVTVTGAKGLVVVFDELDVEYGVSVGYSAAARAVRERRQALLRSLHATLECDERVVALFCKRADEAA